MRCYFLDVLVGRDGEIKQIGAELQRAREGRASVMRISGDPGIGKTALLDITEEQATRSGMSVVRLTAVESESGIPSSALDLLLERLGHRSATSGSPAALLEALSHASMEGPLAVLVDDTQWLDDRSMAALAFACRRLLADPIAVVLVCQPSSAADSPFDSFH